MIRNESTGELRTTSTNSSGRFAIADLLPGTYGIEVVVPGFEIVRRAATIGAERTE